MKNLESLLQEKPKALTDAWSDGLVYASLTQPFRPLLPYWRYTTEHEGGVDHLLLFYRGLEPVTSAETGAIKRP